MEFWQDQTGYRFKTEVVLNAPIKEVFEFFSSAENLEALTPPWLNFKILTQLPLRVKEGSLLDYKISLHRIPIKWRTEIAVWQPPVRFVDQQLRGPFKLWRHEHTFEDLDEGRTLMLDEVNYIPRGGGLIHRFFVKPDLERIFAYRQEKLSEIFQVQESDSRQPATAGCSGC